jgi:hypothetical protein
MLHIATVHYASPRWIEIQVLYLRKHIPVPYKIWASLEEIDPSYSRYFDRVIEQRGMHAGKLNHLAMEIEQEASDDDLLMFLDGDAFPIANPMPRITNGLAAAPLIAVRRAENLNEPQPHPCFCVTTIRTWKRLQGDWSSGPTWSLSPSGRATDVGANLLRRLELTGTPWVQILRSNQRDLHPVFFAIYGDVIYHHGAGFRTGVLSRTDRDGAPKRVPFSEARLVRPVTRLINGQRWRSWERKVAARNLQQSARMFERIQREDSTWLDYLMQPPPTTSEWCRESITS